MTRIPKREAYEGLFDRLDAARVSEFHLEAAWIAYAIVEDRLVSALRQTGGVPTTKKGKPIQMVGPKVKALRDRLPSDEPLRQAMAGGKVLDRVEKWKDDRNPLMHAMAEELKPWDELQDDAKALATTGKEVARDLSSALMRLKKQKRR